jgi:hypothetical protein
MTDVDANVDVSIDATADVEADSGSSEKELNLPGGSTKSSGSAKGQIDDPNAANFDYDRWAAAKGLKGKAEDKPDIQKMKKEADEDQKTKEKAEKKVEKNSDQSEDDQESDEENDSDESDEAESDEADEFELKIKVNGEERTIKGKEEVQKLAQLGAAANEKFQAAANIQKDVQNLFETLKTNPAAVFDHEALGEVFTKAAEKYLYDKYSLETMEPGQRQAVLNQRELDKIRANEQARFEEERSNQEIQQRQSMQKRFEEQFSQALEEGKLPTTGWTIKRMAFHLQSALQQGHQPSSAELAAAVRQDIAEENRGIISQVDDPEELIRLIGEDAVEKIRKYNISKVRGSEDKAKVLNRNSERSQGNRSQPNDQTLFRSAAELMDSITG